MADANLADQQGQLIHTVNPSNFYKDGTFANISEWKHERIPLPPVMEFEAYRLHLKGQHSKEDGILGLDNIHISTRERCTPRYGFVDYYSQLKMMIDLGKHSSYSIKLTS